MDLIQTLSGEGIDSRRGRRARCLNPPGPSFGRCRQFPDVRSGRDASLGGGDGVRFSGVIHQRRSDDKHL